MAELTTRRGLISQVETCLVFIFTRFLLVTTETWETAPAVAESPEIKLFGKWSTDDVKINDISLQVR